MTISVCAVSGALNQGRPSQVSRDVLLEAIQGIVLDSASPSVVYSR
jgi:hypothetical protein